MTLSSCICAMSRQVKNSYSFKAHQLVHSILLAPFSLKVVMAMSSTSALSSKKKAQLLTHGIAGSLAKTFSRHSRISEGFLLRWVLKSSWEIWKRVICINLSLSWVWRKVTISCWMHWLMLSKKNVARRKSTCYAKLLTLSRLKISKREILLSKWSLITLRWAKKTKNIIITASARETERNQASCRESCQVMQRTRTSCWYSTFKESKKELKSTSNFAQI